jgi:hypothetical protein
MLKRIILNAVIFVLPLLSARSQVNSNERIIQVTGIVSDEEMNPVPGVSIISQKLRRGSISELSGIYNVISLPGDTLWFGALGYRRISVIIPKWYNSRQYTRDIQLLNDTIPIKEVFIFPWKNYEEFKRAVLAEKHIDQATINMYNNLAAIQNSILNSSNYAVSPEAGFTLAMQQNANALYSKGQSPVNNLFNPFAWAKLFSGIKNGIFKNQTFNKPVTTKAKKVKVRKKKPARVE